MAERGPAWATREKPETIRMADGAEIRCWTESANAASVAAGSQARISNAHWIFEAAGRQERGPDAEHDQTREQLQRFVDEWWSRRQSPR